MLRVRAELVERIRAATHVADLYELVQDAIELEHSTIPPYLTAAFSIKPGRSHLARQIIVSVANQEMLHMTIAANLLNAIGGNPVIDRPGFIPLYPGPLPLGVHEGLIVSLQKATRGLIYGTFMTIEEPERPLKLRVKQVQTLAAAAPAAPPPPPQGFATIGDFYAAIKQKLHELGPPAFAHPSHSQVIDNTWFPDDQLFPITDVPSACRAIDVIVDQGEGTRKSPLESPGGLPAHYYRLAQIVFGRMLVKDADEPDGYAFAGEAVPLGPTDVWNLFPDAKAVDYPPDSPARGLVERFNFGYTNLLRTLHTAFNGRPTALNEALGLMYELRLLAGNVVSTQILGTPLTGSPTFEYTPTLL
jgi:hypothetical protein